jgi:SSS family solute:Na+ symporter
MGMTIISFLVFTGLVGLITWIITHKDDHGTSNGFFLAGRSLTFPFIAGSLLLTNLSTEQMVGLNGAAFTDGLCVMVWEVVAVIGLIFMALFFLPKFLKSGIATVPQYLEIRFDHQTRVITSLIFLVAYAAILLPIILYTGATGMIGIMDIQGLLGLHSEMQTLILIILVVGIVGSIYALFGGLRSVAVSDTLNGIGLLVGGLMIVFFALQYIGGDGGVTEGYKTLHDALPEKFNSIGSSKTSVPFFTIFSGIILLNLFYWCTNQQIIQRTFGASSLAEGQKGVLLTGLLKLIGPLFLVIPGIIAFYLFAKSGLKADHAYGTLVHKVLPPAFTGFFAAVMLGAILSSFNSALNSTCTIFSLGVYKAMINKDATELQVVKSGKVFGWIIAVIAMCVAPLLAGQDSIFGYLQKMNGLYFIPIFAVVLVGILSTRVPARAAKIGLVTGFALLLIGYFVPLGHQSAELVVKDALVLETSKNVTFKAYLTKPVDHPVNVIFQTLDGVAEEGVNYVGRDNISVTFSPGETEASFSVPLKVDPAGADSQDSNVRRKNFFIKLAAPADVKVKKSYGSYHDSLAACRIIDNQEILNEKSVIDKELKSSIESASEAPTSGYIFFTDFVHNFHFLGAVFIFIFILMLVLGTNNPRKQEFIQKDVKAVDMTPWKHSKLAAFVLLLIVLAIYGAFANFSVLVK